MRWTTTLITPALAALLAGPALAQDGHEGMGDHGEMKGGHMEMRVHGPMAGKMAAHAERLGLSQDQIDRLEALDARLEAEKERHRAEMKAIHEAGMEILTPEQRDRMHQMMKEMRAERGGKKAHGEKKRDGEEKAYDEKKKDEHDGH